MARAKKLAAPKAPSNVLCLADYRDPRPLRDLDISPAVIAEVSHRMREAGFVIGWGSVRKAAK